MKPHSARSSCSAVFLLGCLAASLALAQGEEAETTFYETLDVQVVSVEVVVTDRAGNPVPGLTADDFEIYEDGKLMEITHFSAVERSRPDSAADLAEVEASAAQAAAEAQRVVIFVDNAGIEPSSRKRLLTAVSDFVRDELRPEDQVMVVVHTGTLDLRHRTSGGSGADLSIFDELLRSAATVPQGRLTERAILQEIRDTSLPSEGGGGVGFGSPSQSAAAVESTADDLYRQIQSHAQSRHDDIVSTLDHLRRFVDSLGGLPGHKVLVLLSDKLTLHPGESLLRAWESKFFEFRQSVGVGSSQLGLSELDVSPHLRELASHANANRVTFYAMTGQGGGPPQSVSAEGGMVDLGALGTPGGGFTQSIASDAADAASLAGALQFISEATGGVATANTRNLDGALERVGRDMDLHYSLAYSPPGKPDGKDHRIGVKVKRPELTVRHREGHLAQTSDERMNDQTLTALLLEEENNELSVALEFGEEKAEQKGRYLVPVTVKIPLANLVLVPAGQFHEGKVSIFVGSRDSKGRTSPIQKVPVPIRIPNEKLLTALGQVAGYRVSLLMREGAHSVAVGVRDELGHVESTVRGAYTPGGSGG